MPTASTTKNNSVDAAASPIASKHTPGPWHVVGPDPTKRNPHVGLWLVESDQINVANHCTYADACLLAAAPDLLAALRRIAYEPFGHPDASHREVLDAITEFARTAITKAGG